MISAIETIFGAYFRLWIAEVELDTREGFLGAREMELLRRRRRVVVAKRGGGI